MKMDLILALAILPKNVILALTADLEQLDRQGLMKAGKLSTEEMARRFFPATYKAVYCK